MSCIVPREKGAVPQRMVVPDVLREPLRSWWQHESCPVTGPVFPVRLGPRAGENRTRGNTSFAKRLRRDLARALRWAGIEPRRELFEETPLTLPVDFHSFRRSYNTALADADVSVQKAMALAGHSDPKTHMRYVRLATAAQQVPEAALPNLTGIRIGASGNRPGIVSNETIQSEEPPESARHARFERATPAFGGQCSIQLSQWRERGERYRMLAAPATPARISRKPRPMSTTSPPTWMPPVGVVAPAPSSSTSPGASTVWRSRDGRPTRSPCSMSIWHGARPASCNHPPRLAQAEPVAGSSTSAPNAR